MDPLIYQTSPRVVFAGNTFENVPIILQYEAVPLVEIVKTANAGFTVQIPIYHSDGTYLAKVVGSQLYATDAGKKAGIVLHYPKNKTVCELNGRVIFEIFRAEAASLKTHAELYTPDGAFLKCTDSDLLGYVLGPNREQMQLRGLILKGNVFSGLGIGVWVKKNGDVAVGVPR